MVSRIRWLLAPLATLAVLVIHPSISDASQSAPFGAASTVVPSPSNELRPLATQAAAAKAPLNSPAFISMGYYPGWEMNKTPVTEVDYSAFTTIMSFGMYPSADGGVGINDMQSAENARAQVTAAHMAGKKINLTIGGEGQGTGFVGAAGNRHRATFVRNIINTMQTYGYDGVDIDWEEQVPEHQGDYIALIQELRGMLNVLSPVSYLSVDVDTGQIPPPIVAQLYASVDSVNLMSFRFDGLDQVSAYTSAGVPAHKLILGIGLSADYVDKTVENVQTKVKLAKTKGLLGTLCWEIGNLKTAKTDLRLQPLRRAVAGSAAV